ncbi:unnamed protein product [Bursaphelenchus okinawaensis]|uniref:Uncharacterized protein n=1 Tax=Bursaphelenchus okinawaensis TaxID=465554 RepID=A0A811KJX2_9BILA|nr:unnamed protein product [Bursaphelenchus okinawaensis]CAG9104478.1 unnamed protein product [Bursaphelenchus okinawaensis]
MRAHLRQWLDPAPADPQLAHPSLVRQGQMNCFVLLFYIASLASCWKLEVPNARPGPEGNKVEFGTKDRNVLKCSVSGFEPGDSADLEWQYDKKYVGRVNQHRQSDGSRMLTFKKAFTPADSGEFTCIGKVGDEVKEIQKVFVTFVEEPDFSEVEEEQHPIVNQDARIRCPVKNVPENVEVYWTQNEAVVTRDLQTTVEDDGKTLVLRNYSKTSDGVYECSVQFLDRVRTVDIEVLGYMPPVIVKDVMPSVVYEGQDLQLVCTADGFPTPKIQWSKMTNARKVEAINGSPKYDLSLNGVLVIKNTSVLDEGKYICTAVNELDTEDSRNVSLTVLPRPRINPFGDLIVEEGASLTVPCFTHNDTDVTEWTTYGGIPLKPYVDGSDIGYKAENGTSYLIINNINRNSNNKFVCVAHNEAGKSSRVAHIKVTVAPKVAKSGNGVKRSVLNGSPILLSCNASGIPTPEITWFKDGEPIEYDGTSFSLDEISDIPTLKITPTTTNQFGTYNCKAKNNLGSTEGDKILLLQVLEPKLPTLACNEYFLPTRMRCKVDFKNIKENNYPTNLSATFKNINGSVVYLVEGIPVEDGFIEVENLNTSSAYRVHFKAYNERGATDWSKEEYKVVTADPQAPERVRNVTSNCTENCHISWIPGRDNGEPITGYKVHLYNKDKKELWSTSCNETFTDIFNLDSLVHYEVTVEAVNEIGTSDPTSHHFTTSEFATSTSFVAMIVVICLIVLMLTLVGADYLCYRVKGFSLLQRLYRCGRKTDVDVKINKPENESLIEKPTKPQV